MKKNPKEDPSGYGKAPDKVSSEILKMYVWGVFKNKAGYYSNTYYKEMNYPTLVKPNLSKEEAEKLVISMKGKR